jgi:DNA-directed RNA polymerase sigma subunit (sigma70/sigma32)
MVETVKKVKKFSMKKEVIKNMNNADIITVTIKANNEKSLITFEEIKDLFKSLVDKDKSNEKVKIVGANKYREVWTIKTQYVNDILPFENYMINKTMSNYINEFYQVEFIKMP